MEKSLITNILSWLGWVVAGLVTFTKVWKALFGSEFSTDVKKGFPMFMKWVFKNSAMQAAIMNELKQIKNEVAYNGGSITLSDAVKGLEKDSQELKYDNRELKDAIQELKARRDVSDLCDERMIFRVNTDSACVFINNAFLKFFGYAESDVLEYRFEDLVHEEDRNEMHLKWNKAIQTATSFWDEQRIKDCHGVWHNCTVIAFPIMVNKVLKGFSGTITVNDLKTT